MIDEGEDRQDEKEKLYSNKIIKKKYLTSELTLIRDEEKGKRKLRNKQVKLN